MKERDGDGGSGGEEGGLGTTTGSKVRGEMTNRTAIAIATGGGSGGGGSEGGGLGQRVQGRRTMRGLAFSAEADNDNVIEKKKTNKKATTDVSKTNLKMDDEDEDKKKKEKKEKAKQQPLASSASALGGRGMDRKQKAKATSKDKTPHMDAVQLRFDLADSVNHSSRSTSSSSSSTLSPATAPKRRSRSRSGGSSRGEKGREHDELEADGDELNNNRVIGSVVKLTSSQSSAAAASLNSSRSTKKKQQADHGNRKALKADDQTPRLRQLQRAIVADDPHRVAEAISLGADVNHLYQTEVRGTPSSPSAAHSSWCLCGGERARVLAAEGSMQSHPTRSCCAS
jgi:hypothetical protein